MMEKEKIREIVKEVEEVTDENLEKVSGGNMDKIKEPKGDDES